MKVFGPNSLFKPQPRLFKYKACLILFNSETTQGAYFSDKHLFEPKNVRTKGINRTVIS